MGRDFKRREVQGMNTSARKCLSYAHMHAVKVTEDAIFSDKIT